MQKKEVMMVGVVPLSKEDVKDMGSYREWSNLDDDKVIGVGRLQEAIKGLEEDMFQQPLTQKTLETCMKYVKKWLGGIQ